MNTPGFTADASLYRARRQYRSLAIHALRSDNELIPQYGRDRAERIRDTLGTGTVHCTPGKCLRYSDRYFGTCILWEDDDCYWWPW
jgi:hypothetical protein